MVKKFSYFCDFAGEQHPVTFYVGDAVKGSHPIAFQSKWLSKTKGGVVPQNLMESLEKLKIISDTQKISFEELCEYVIQVLQSLQPAKITSK